MSSKLVFMVLEQLGQDVQVVCSLSRLETVSDADKKAFRNAARRGDWFSVVGHLHKTARGEPSLIVSELPRLQSPSLHQVPTKLEHTETKARRPHVGMLVNPAETQTLRLRSRIETLLARWFDEHDFTKVNTPIITAGAGGATARPFITNATELRLAQLNLRIAPELWLKRLILGGMGKVYELGPAFRNEGVDATHNPEFTMCEFYWPFQSLNQLMTTTENMFHYLFEQLSSLDPSLTSHLNDSIVHRPDADHKPQSPFPKKFNRLPFIPTLEKEMGLPLPNLELPESTDLLQALFRKKSLPLPAQPTIPTLLDTLSGAYIEPLCTSPTFITEPPAALSPLAKSFRCPATGHLVSARAELFIAGAEYANMYEEENSPFEQRKKLEAQLDYRRQVDPSATVQIDESYLEALEWGLPPTGGWGLGVDRLVMLFTGRKRIGDVLPFGTLRNVVGLQRAWRK
ncbi:class II aaRS and biotin synthetase [Myriangium duriaei CBS 260.36]|uniref:Class II aaRS and biotin synthetase n=1 Tax=Myriangium duriaei CBS 260.36 TaxID=1168546 RepID=A0A9P4IZM0_9PEZI|nr:class II aaRS and biotin synthetase [Myriangium duriaei CBS 260.36]